MKQIIVNCADRETRVAVMENKRLSDLFIERPIEQRVVGNIYKGRVTDILPGMQAAFVNIGLEKNAYLYVDDCFPTSSKKGEGKKPNIREVLKQGQEILVQVTKEPLGTKGARVTTQFSFPGRFLVYMPDDPYVGISRKIEKESVREKLHLLLTSLCQGTEGTVVRTLAEEASEDEIRADFIFLQGLWTRTQQTAKQSKGIGVVYRDLELVPRIARDLLTEDIDEFILDSLPAYNQVIEQLEYAIPDIKKRMKLYRERTSIFDAFEVEGEIEKALRRKVWLKSGGYLVIDQTEALTVIDVNTGKFTGTHDLEETVFKTNQEAAKEIIRQLRLRDIGGIILIDFIDMRTSRHQEAILNGLKEQVKKERTKTHILGFTQLGLLEMTRKKARQSLSEVLMTLCSYCEGRGAIFSDDTIMGKMEREIKEYSKASDVEAILIEAHPHIAELLQGKNGGNLKHMEQQWGISIYVHGQEKLHQQHYHFAYVGNLMECKRRAAAAQGKPL